MLFTGPTEWKQKAVTQDLQRELLRLGSKPARGHCDPPSLPPWDSSELWGEDEGGRGVRGELLFKFHQCNSVSTLPATKYMQVDLHNALGVISWQEKYIKVQRFSAAHLKLFPLGVNVK